VRCALVFFLVGCSKTNEPVVVAPPGPVPSSVPSAAPTLVVTKAAAPCTVAIGATSTFSIPPRLQAIAPQYFHVTAHDDGFNDLVPGTKRYQWYDPSDLMTAVDPPPDMTMIGRSTAHWYFGHASDGSLRVARRTDTKATRIPGTWLNELDAVEDGSGGLWMAFANLSSLVVPETRIVHVDPTMKITDFNLATTPNDPWDRRIGITADGHVAFVWVGSMTGGVALMASWLGPAGFSAPFMLDSVMLLSPDEQDLTLRTTTNLRVTAEGPDRLAVGWRPLAPKPGEVAPPGPPPDRAASAEIRLLTTDPTGAVGSRSTYPTRALPLGGTSGVGPWPLAGNGMAAATYGGHAVFFWNDAPRGAVVWTTLGGVPSQVASGFFRIAPRGSDVLLLTSSGSQLSAPISCR
jgi:hypothetical protein